MPKAEKKKKKLVKKRPGKNSSKPRFKTWVFFFPNDQGRAAKSTRWLKKIVEEAVVGYGGLEYVLRSQSRVEISWPRPVTADSARRLLKPLLLQPLEGLARALPLFVSGLPLRLRPQALLLQQLLRRRLGRRPRAKVLGDAALLFSGLLVLRRTVAELAE